MCTGAGWLLGHPDTKNGTVAWSNVQGVYSRGIVNLLGGNVKSDEEKFGFVNIAAGVYHDVTDTCVMTEYDNQGAAAA